MLFFLLYLNKSKIYFMVKEKTIQEICMSFVKNKNEKTFINVINRLRPGLNTHLMKIEGDYETRNYLLNVTFSKLWTELDKYDSKKGYFSTWAYRIARNEALQHKRYTNKHSSYEGMMEQGLNAIKNHESVSIEPDEFFDEKENRDIVTELHNEVINCIKTLPDSDSKTLYKKVLFKKIIENKRYSQIAKEVGICENTAKVRVFNGKKIINKIISKKNPELIIAYKKFINK